MVTYLSSKTQNILQILGAEGTWQQRFSFQSAVKVHGQHFFPWRDLDLKSCDLEVYVLCIECVIFCEVISFDIDQCNAIYEECVCRGTPSIGIITNSGLISHHNLGHYLL